jgi:NADH pyrophosphatase NudC (nudix superfamily)
MTNGAFAVVTKNSQVLLVKPPTWVKEFSDHWNFPGGVVNEGESLENGAKREVLEETGIVCEIGELLDSAVGKELTVRIFKADYVSGEIKIQEEELIEAKWFSIDAALKLPLAYDIKSTLEKIYSNIV